MQVMMKASNGETPGLVGVKTRVSEPVNARCILSLGLHFFFYVVKNSTNVHQDVKILNLKVGQKFIFRPRHASLNCLRRDAFPSIANAETVAGNRLLSTSSSLLTKH
jgi:hypothetical protein